MKAFCASVILSFLSFSCSSQPQPQQKPVEGQQTIAIIPEPVTMRKNPGEFSLKGSTTISVPEGNSDAGRVAEFLASALSAPTGNKYSINEGAGGNNSISLSLNSAPEKNLGDEGYRLNVTAGSVSIEANSAAGLFYGTQTFLQLLPPSIESKTKVTGIDWTVPAVEITDYPRFKWRGLMFDVVRHFFTKEEVKKFIDDMVKYKYNILHLHLTDDQGWRIQIKSLPKLTEVGAWNVKKVGQFGTFSQPAENEPRNYGGFYTQEDIKEIVKYAADRFVNILPEVDVPGHSLAAIASYPEISCTPGKYRVNSGEKFMNWYTGGFSALIDNTICPANEKAYEFLDKVFTEVAQLFPFEYIHMGGDEAAKNFWEKNAQIKALMQREKLKDMHEVQSYFVKRVQKIIESKGKKMIGWDEIMEGGLAKGAAVMSWRGLKGGVEAAKMGNEVVMSPTTYAYLDYMQSDVLMEPPVYASLRLKKTYEFEPVPDGVDAKYIKGAQANLWTEQIYNYRQVQYMLWPRAFSIAETAWSQKGKKDWDEFVKKVEYHFERFDAAEKKYAPSMYDPDIKTINDKEQLKVELIPELDGLDIYYSFDNSWPDRFYPKYTGRLSVPKDARNLKVVTYRGKEQVGRPIILPIAELKKRAKIKD